MARFAIGRGSFLVICGIVYLTSLIFFAMCFSWSTSVLFCNWLTIEWILQVSSVFYQLYFEASFISSVHCYLIIFCDALNENIKNKVFHI